MNRVKYRLAVGFAGVMDVVRSFTHIASGTRTLMYHDIADSEHGNDLYVLPGARFRDHIETVAAWANKEGVTFNPIGPTPRPGIAVTFDDGYLSTLTTAAPILIKHNIPFHVFVTKSYCQSGNTRYLTETLLRELAAVPLASFGTHGVTHVRLEQTSRHELQSELIESRDWLEQVLQRPIDSMSYPHGSISNSVVTAVEMSGYNFACASQPGTFLSPDQRLRIPRIDIWSCDSAHVALQKLRGAWDQLL